MGKYLTRDQILNADDMAYEDVEVPEWGGTVRVKTMSAAEKDAFEGSLTEIRQVGNSIVQRPNLHNVRAKLLARCMVDEVGALLFSENDILDLGRKSAAAMDRVLAVAKRRNAMSEQDLKELSEQLKNAQPAASPTD